jgi:flagellar basal-body rod modification protein FlgD
MIANEVDSNAAGKTLLSPSPSKVLGKDDFLNLLITQLQNQDPLNPTDSAEFTAQLAQFSSLEQLGNVNENLVELINFQTSSNNSQAVSLIGKAITARGNSIQLSEERPVHCKFKLAEAAATVKAYIYDSSDELVAEVETQNLSAGHHSLAWDGTDNRGKQMADGTYTFEILAEGADGQSIDAIPVFSGRIEKVAFENNVSYLIAGNQKIALGDVIEVAAPEP